MEQVRRKKSYSRLNNIQRQIFEKLYMTIFYWLPEFLPEISWEKVTEEIFSCFMVFSFLPKKCALYLKKNAILCLYFHVLWCFLFYQKKCALYLKKNAILCLFFKNVSPSKRVVCFILNYLHFPMVEGIAFYALHKSRLLIISCKADGFCLFIGLPDEI